MSWQPIAMAGFGQGLGLGLIFVPLSLQTFGTLPMVHRNEATALFSLVRNVGGSIGISVAENYLARATQVSHAAIAANVTPYNQSLWDPGISAMWNIHTMLGLAAINGEVTQQASMIAYLQCFTLMAAICVVMIPMLLIMRQVGQQPGRGAAHAAMD
jgi:DHA2 family multidrug resistance protein